MLCAGVGVMAVRNKTVTIDEFHHLPAGCLICRTGEFYMHPKSPPLARVWSALPGMLMDLEVPTEPHWREYGTGWDTWIYGTAFHVRNPQRYRTVFFWGRLMNSLWLLPLGLCLFAWARKLYGERAAWLAIGLLGLSPTFLAHGPLVTTDLSAATFFFCATYLFWASRGRPREMTWVAGAGAVLGLGMLTKFTLVLLPVAWIGIELVMLLTDVRSSQQAAAGEGAAWRAGTRRLIKRLAVVGALAFGVVNAGYGFRGTFTSISDLPCKSRIFARLRNSPLARLPVPLPYSYLAGLDAQKGDADTGEFTSSYLLGRWADPGWWYYYLVVIPVKIPTALLLLFGWAIVLARRWVPSEDRWTRLCLGVPPGLVFVVLCLMNRLNIGVRYLLPVLPFAMLYASRLLAPACVTRAARRWLAVLGIWFAASSLCAFPDYLSYFTEVVGGRTHGHRYVVDSNLDWGQDLYRLKPVMQKHGIDVIKLAYFGHVWAQMYGIDFELVGGKPEPGWIAASVSFVMGQQYSLTYAGDAIITRPPGFYQWLQRYEPVERVGDSIWLYHIRPEDISPGARERP